MFQKFIVEEIEEEGLCLILGKCNFHKDLAYDATKVKGGGIWQLDMETKTFTLSGSSFDFGKAKLEDLIFCVRRKKTFSNYTLLRNFSEDGFSFIYKNETGEIIKL